MNPTKDLESILQFRKKRNWQQFHSAKNLAISLMLEASEVVEVFQWSKDHKVPKDKKDELADELADVYYWILLLAYDEGIDLSKSLERKMKKNAKKYPVDKSKDSSKKYTELK